MEIVYACKVRPRKFENFKFFSLLKNILKKKIYNDIMCSSEAKAMKFENF